MIKFDTLRKNVDLITLDTFKRGMKNGISLIINLSKIIIPIYIIMTFLQHTPVIDALGRLFEPVMRVIGLPGDAAIALVLGNFINIGAAIGAILPLALTTKQITIISVMLSFSHALPIETAICKKIGVSGMLVISIRLAVAAISGVILNLLL